MNINKLFITSLLPMVAVIGHSEDLDLHILDDYIIKSSPLTLNSAENSQSYCAIENEALDDINANTIAETISFEPGISQTYYGPNANRPIIRGLDGFRVSVLENGLKNFDLSATSNDHAVTINPLLLNRIEILRGASTLVYGSNSIGGLINVFDNSIPSRWKSTTLENKFKVRTSSVDDGKNYGGIIFEKIGNFDFQINASKISTKNYSTPGFKLHHHEHLDSIQYAAFRNGELTTNLLTHDDDHDDGHDDHDDGHDDHDDGHDDHDELLNYVANTHSEVENFGFGGSYNSDNGYIGLSYSEYSSSYGVPNHESSVISIDRNKTALEGSYDLDTGYFDNLRFSLVDGDYLHTEAGTHEDLDQILYEYHAGDGFEVAGADHDDHDDGHDDHDDGHDGHDDGHDDHGHHASFITKGIDASIILSKKAAQETTAFSLSFSNIDMKIDGEESYLAAMDHFAYYNAQNKLEDLQKYRLENDNRKIAKIDNDSAKSFGIGIMQKKQLSDSLSVNGGLRYESLSRDYDASLDDVLVDIDREDSSFNTSLGFVFENSNSIVISGNIHYSERIPETSELFSYGAHHATESFEIGNPDLENEESSGIEFAIANKQGALNHKLSVYYNDYKNFIFQDDTGSKTGTDKWAITTDTDELPGDAVFADEDGNEIYYIRPEFESLKIREYVGVEATIYGLEYEFDYVLTQNSYIRGFADLIKGKNKSENIALPRIPPYRFGVGYYLNSQFYRFNLTAVHHGKQDNLASGEEETNSYTFLNARLGFSPLSKDGSEIYIKVNNLTNRLAYVHSSFLKESAPLPGRNVEIGYNVTF